MFSSFTASVLAVVTQPMILYWTQCCLPPVVVVGAQDKASSSGISFPGLNSSEKIITMPATGVFAVLGTLLIMVFHRSTLVVCDPSESSCVFYTCSDRIFPGHTPLPTFLFLFVHIVVLLLTVNDLHIQLLDHIDRHHFPVSGSPVAYSMWGLAH